MTKYYIYKMFRSGVADEAYACFTIPNAAGTAELPVRLDLANHSPDGFEWGYHGSGPAQLSLAILAHYFGDSEIGKQRALYYYQQFKDLVVARKPRDDSWEITTGEIEYLVKRMEEDRNLHQVDNHAHAG